MAFTPMDTGYKPEFALGAWVAGENAANQRALAQEELIKNYLANQRETSMQPLDKSIKETEAARAKVGRSSPMLDAYQRGYVGQADSQEAAGKKALGTLQGDINLTNVSNENRIAVENLLQKLNKLKAGGVSGRFDTTGQIDTPTQILPQQAGFNWQVSPEQQLLKDQEALRLRQDELLANPNDKALQDDIKRLTDRINTVPTSPASTKEMTKIAFPMKAPSRNIQSDNPEYEQLMSALMDTPELRAALLKGDQKADSAEYMKLLQVLKDRDVAEARKAQDKAENESQMLAWAHRTAADPNASPELKAQAKAMIDSVAMRKLMGSAQGWATGLDVPQISGQPAMPTPVQKAQAAAGQPPVASPSAAPVAITNETEWSKLAPGTKYKMPDGRIGTK